MTALDGTIVWDQGNVLMQRTSDGVTPVKGAPAGEYRWLDLGRDRRNRLVLTYMRCELVAEGCKIMRDDLDGHRATFKQRLAPKRCSTGAPALWRARMAYWMRCNTAGEALDRKRSGLYVKTAGHAPKQMRLPAAAQAFPDRFITHVDLRGTRVAAVANVSGYGTVVDTYDYAFTEKVNRRQLRSLLVAHSGSDGDGIEETRGIALGSGGVLWTLVNARAKLPTQSIVSRITGSCYERERFHSPPDPDFPDRFRVNDLAVDGSKLYLNKRDIGIVRHDFVPEAPGCVPL